VHADGNLHRVSRDLVRDDQPHRPDQPTGFVVVKHATSGLDGQHIRRNGAGGREIDAVQLGNGATRPLPPRGVAHRSRQGTHRALGRRVRRDRTRRR
jgi:hypothetical protein